MVYDVSSTHGVQAGWSGILNPLKIWTAYLGNKKSSYLMSKSFY